MTFVVRRFDEYMTTHFNTQAGPRWWTDRIDRDVRRFQTADAAWRYLEQLRASGFKLDLVQVIDEATALLTHRTSS